MPLVSIVIPVYNVENYIENCVKSCLNQTFQDIEIIIINDGSTDQSGDIAQKYAEKYAHIKLFHTKNGGLSRARNTGFNHCSGKYVYFLDSDDWIEHNCIEMCVHYAEKYDLDIVTFDAKPIKMDDLVSDACLLDPYDRSNGIEAYRVFSGKDFIRAQTEGIVYVFAWSVFMKREFLCRHSICFPPDVYYEDNRFHFDCMLYVQRMMYLPFAFYNRSFHADSIVSSAVNLKKVRDSYAIMNEILHSLQIYAGDDKAFWLQYCTKQITGLFQFSHKQINFKNISLFWDHWYEIEAMTHKSVTKYLELLKQISPTSSIIEEAYLLLWSLIEPFQRSTPKLYDCFDMLSNHFKKFFVYKRLAKLPLNQAGPKVGIYGSGNHAWEVLRVYHDLFGEIRCDIVFIDTYKKSYTEQFMGHDVVNIKDCSQLELSSIVILSHLYESQMLAAAREVMGETLPIYTLYDTDTTPIMMQLPLEQYCLQKLNARGNEPQYKTRLVLLEVPAHDNIGDHIITMAEEQFFKRHFPDYELLKFSDAEWQRDQERVVNAVGIMDIVVITGGGFIGDLWIGGAHVLEMIYRFLRNKIIIFPQSMYLDADSQQREKELYAAFLRHENITLCHRDAFSFQRGQRLFGSSVKQYLLPDMALTLNFCEETINRTGILLCLRTDKETRMSDDDRNAIRALCRRCSETVNETSMHYGVNISDSDKNVPIRKKLNEFRAHQLVITDTLHCMISCVITGTACIAINNLTDKVKGVYDWVKELNYVRCMDDWQQLNQADILELMHPENHAYPLRFEEYMEQLAKIIKEEPR